MKQETPLDFLNDYIAIRTKLTPPKNFSSTTHASWAQALAIQDEFRFMGQGFEQKLDVYERMYINMLLCVCRLLLELGRVPVFEKLQITQFNPADEHNEQYYLEFKVPCVHHIPSVVYKIAVKAALNLCFWMANNPPTKNNQAAVFDSIEKNVVRPLHRLVPAGKSTIPVLKVAHSRGIPFTHLGFGVYQLGWGSKARRLDRSASELDSAIGAKFSQNKAVSANLLSAAGLPAPVHVVVSNEQQAESAAMRLGFPVVVKPCDRDRGEGVTVNVNDNVGLKSAFALAHSLANNKQVIIERQAPGICHRLFIVGNALLYAVKRLPMLVRGDGIHTVQQLVDHEIRLQAEMPPWGRSVIQSIDKLALGALHAAGFSPESVPPDGVIAPLRNIESTEWGGVDEDITHQVHPANLSAALNACKLFGLYIGGIDIISPDISVPWSENGAIINEVNFAPLLGGAEISRSYLPAFFDHFIEGDGKIPILLFEDQSLALERQEDSQSHGLRCFYTSKFETLDPSGFRLEMPVCTIKQRIRALMLRTDVDAIVVLVN